MPTLSQYTAQVRRLLHDANSTFYTSSDVTDAINGARKQVALDTACLRQLFAVSGSGLTTGTETYSLGSLTSVTTRAIDLLGITVIWGQTRVPLFYMAFTEFQVRMRTWVTNRSRPAVWSNTGIGPGMTIYIQPVPDQNYSAYADVIYIPNDLVDDSTVDEITFPYADAVKYYAAYQCKFKEQNFGEAEIFKNQYKDKAMWALSQSFTRRMPNPYSGTWGGVY